MKRALITLLFAVATLVSMPFSAFALDEGYALADGTVTDIKPFMPNVSVKDACDISYDVVIDGKSYSESGAHDTNGFCHLEAGDTIKIKYLESDPRKHSIASEFDMEDMSSPFEGMPNPLLSLIPFGVVFIISIAVAIKATTSASRKMSDVDVDGDGLTGDNKPATTEQKKLIVEGFRKLGVYHEVKRGLTQAQARETLREIEKQLTKNKPS